MPNTFRKGSNLDLASAFIRIIGESSPMGLLKGALLVTSMAALCVPAAAQSYASSNAAINYSFSLDANSAGLGAYLGVQDNGESTYNLINLSGLPYTSTTGPTAAADAIVSTDTIFNGYNASSGDWTGYNGVFTDAYETGTPGSATSSAGSMEFLSVTNYGTAAITLDVTAIGYCFGSAMVTGTTSPGNYATSAAYTEIGDYDYGTAVWSNPFIGATGNAATGVNTGYTAEWTPLDPTVFGPGAFSGTYEMTIAAGDTHALEFFVETQDAAVTGAVPNTPGFATLGIGLLGLLIGRKRLKH